VVEKGKQTSGVAAADLRYFSPAGEFEAYISALEVGIQRLAKRQGQGVHFLQIHSYIPDD
jgi:hypothetical protein